MSNVSGHDDQPVNNCRRGKQRIDCRQRSALLDASSTTHFTPRFGYRPIHVEDSSGETRFEISKPLFEVYAFSSVGPPHFDPLPNFADRDHAEEKRFLVTLVEPRTDLLIGPRLEAIRDDVRIEKEAAQRSISRPVSL
jgi:hypothetical protein